MYKGRQWQYNSIFNILAAIYLFLLFKNLPIKYNKFINYISKYTFGVYILHSVSFLYTILWKDIAKCDMFYKSNYMILHLFGTVIGVYIVCLICDIIREYIFKSIERKIKLKDRYIELE